MRKKEKKSKASYLRSPFSWLGRHEVWQLHRHSRTGGGGGMHRRSAKEKNRDFFPRGNSYAGTINQYLCTIILYNTNNTNDAIDPFTIGKYYVNKA